MAAGNLLVIFVILCNRKMRNDVNFFLVNLAIADLCVGVFCIMPNLYLYISQYWLIGRVRNYCILSVIDITRAVQSYAGKLQSLFIVTNNAQLRSVLLAAG